MPSLPNGGNLAECFSNVLALTELNNLQWRIYETSGVRGVSVQDDLVLIAYSKCVKDGILATWRRKPTQSTSTHEPLPIPSFTNDVLKELWIFWYGAEEPEHLAEHTSELEKQKNDDMGGDECTGISIEVRHQLFNALKRLIERNLAKERIIRFGRWFGKPLSKSHPRRHHLSSKHILGWDLQFFIHGGNIVCMTTRAQYQPTIFRLSKVHLECSWRLPVILSPDSLRGYLVPAKEHSEFRSMNSFDSQWKSWNNYFVLDNEEPEDEVAKRDRIPRLVQVEIDNVRFYYPSCLVCVTLEDDLVCHRRKEGKPMRAKDETAMAMHTTEELIAADSTKRNPLILDQVSGLQHFQAVVENSLLNNSVFEKRRSSGTSTTNDDGFRAPFPVQADDNTKWNFTENENNPDLHQPCTSSHDCHPTPKEQLIIKQVIGDNLQVTDELRRVDDLKDPNNDVVLRVFNARTLRRNAAHRRFSTSSMNQRKQKRAKSPISEEESDPSDCDGPSWTRTNSKRIETGITCADEKMLNLLNKRRNHFSTSSDDDDRVPSPFTPLRVVSPCTSSCLAPYGVNYEMLPESTFADLFTPSTSSLPFDASQKQRSEKYHYVYNPFLTHKENYKIKPYHRMRENRQRKRPPFPSPLRVAPSPEPEQPGSQETIPATTSPPPLTVGFAEECVMAKQLTEFGLDKEDLRHHTRRKKNKKKAKLAKWGTVDTFNMDSVLSVTEELPLSTITPLCGFYNPKVEELSPIENNSENEERQSEILLPEKMESREPMTEYNDSCMDVSSPMDNFLSPPASNELPEQYVNNSWPRVNNGPPSVPDQFVNHSWPRVNNGPHSVDPALNQIYPTPPSILVDQQQFSPSGPVMVSLIQQHSVTAEDIRPIQIKEDPEDAPDSSEDESEPDETVLPVVDRSGLLPVYQQLYDQTTKIPGWRSRRDSRGRYPSKSQKELKEQKRQEKLKRLQNPSTDYEKLKNFLEAYKRPSAPNTSQSNKQRLKSLQDLPPDYEKVKNYLETNKKPPAPTIEFKYTPLSDKQRQAQGKAPVAVTNNGEYKCSYDNSQAPRETSTMHGQMANMMTPYGPNNPMGGPVRGMIGGPMMNQAPRMSYNPHYPPHMQGNSFQQLNNFVNGPMPSMYGGMPQGHMGGGMMPMMGNPNYGGPNNGPMGMYGGPQGNMMGNMGYGGDPNNMVHGMQQGNYMNQYGGMPNGGMGMRQIPPQNSMMNQSMSMNVVPSTPTTPVTPQKDMRMPEGSGVVLALVLQDTILNLHFDTIFDSCPICSCTGSIKDSALGLYITPADVLRTSAQQQKNSIHPWSGFYTSSSSTDSCVCGFSSVRHRYLSMQSGLFLEDSREATASLNDTSLAPVTTLCNEDGSMVNNQIWFDPANSKDIHMVNLIRNLCKRFSVSRVVNQISLFNETMEKAAKGQDIGFSIGSSSEYIISQIDSTELMLLGNSTIDMALVPTHTRNNNSQQHDHKFFQYFHPWGLQVANAIREPETDAWKALMGEITPIIEASMKIVRRLTTGTVIEGPLTWRSLIGKRGKAVSTQEDDYLPEPIPYVTVGRGQEIDYVSALTVNDWENAGLSPADVPKDVLYLAIVPDDQFIYEKTKVYMDELTDVYESRNLGHHMPLRCEGAREGIISVGGSNKFISTPSAKYNTPSMHYLDIVGKYVENRQIMSRLRLYTQQMEETLGNIFSTGKPFFGRENYISRLNARSADQCTSLREAEEMNYVRDYKTEISREERVPIDEVEVPPLTDAERTKSFREVFQDTGPMLPHVIVIYVVNPFTYGSDSQTAVNARTSQLAILRAYNEVIEGLPPKYRPQLQVATIELSQILTLSGYNQDFGAEFASRGNAGVFENRTLYDFDADTTEGEQPDDLLKSLAMSVYSAPRSVTPECLKSIQARCMTVFGPASTMQGMLSSLEKEGSQIAYTIPSSPYYLAPPNKLTYVPGTPKTKDDAQAKYGVFPVDEMVLHIAYCLSGNEFLFAHVTDSLGRLSENCTINLRTQTRAPFKYRAKTQILDTLTKLWNFIQGVVTSDIRNCRLVINRLGRIGHGEFRAWTHLLSKTSLRRLFPKECGTCTETKGITNLPVVLSACLISTEPEPYIRLFPQYNNITAPKGKKKDNTLSNLSTPEDVSCTHIMVVPVPTYIDLTNVDQAMPDDTDDDNDIFGLGNTLEQDDELSDFRGIDMGDLMDSSDGPALPSAALKGSNQFFPENGQGEIQNQPLAIGFHISTAPAGDLPDWFWSSCPSAKYRDTVHMKSSLHISLQCSQGEQDQGDEFITQSKPKQSSGDDIELQHPLDSNRTDEVLRYVLESHNALSWLLIDPCTGDRRSCLPLHMQKLLELYHTTNRLLV